MSESHSSLWSPPSVLSSPHLLLFLSNKKKPQNKTQRRSLHSTDEVTRGEVNAVLMRSGFGTSTPSDPTQILPFGERIESTLHFSHPLLNMSNGSLLSSYGKQHRRYHGGLTSQLNLGIHHSPSHSVCCKNRTSWCDKTMPPVPHTAKSQSKNCSLLTSEPNLSTKKSSGYIDGIH